MGKGKCFSRIDCQNHIPKVENLDQRIAQFKNMILKHCCHYIKIIIILLLSVFILKSCFSSGCIMPHTGQQKTFV